MDREEVRSCLCILGDGTFLLSCFYFLCSFFLSSCLSFWFSSSSCCGSSGSGGGSSGGVDVFAGDGCSVEGDNISSRL